MRELLAIAAHHIAERSDYSLLKHLLIVAEEDLDHAEADLEPFVAIGDLKFIDMLKDQGCLTPDNYEAVVEAAQRLNQRGVLVHLAKFQPDDE